MSWLIKIKDWFVKVWNYLKEVFYTGERCHRCFKQLDLMGDVPILGVRGRNVTFYICEDCVNDMSLCADVSA